MLHEKPGNDFHWKNKLEEIKSLPGETFNKEAAWEKLHERMQGKFRNKKAVWYWVAAACLLFAIIIPWVLVNKKESVLVKNNSVQKQIQSTSSHLSESIIDTSPVKDTSAVKLSAEKKLPPFPVEKSNKINSLFNHNRTQFAIVLDKKEKEEFITQKITNNAVIPVDTVISVVAIMPEKKKLKVVHINELGDHIAETPNVARYSDRHTFQLKLINQEVYTNSLLLANTGFNIFKTKNAP